MTQTAEHFPVVRAAPHTIDHEIDSYTPFLKLFVNGILQKESGKRQPPFRNLWLPVANKVWHNPGLPLMLQPAVGRFLGHLGNEVLDMDYHWPPSMPVPTAHFHSVNGLLHPLSSHVWLVECHNIGQTRNQHLRLVYQPAAQP